MNGTEWTEPGRGATTLKLYETVIRYSDLNARSHLCELAADHGGWRHGGWDEHRTNLRLTGAPLTAEDLARIARAK